MYVEVIFNTDCRFIGYCVSKYFTQVVTEMTSTPLLVKFKKNMLLHEIETKYASKNTKEEEPGSNIIQT